MTKQEPIARSPGKSLAILSYHKIGPPAAGGWDTWYYISEEIFSADLELLRRGGWQFIDLSALYRGIQDASAMPEKSALITFDDGYRNNLTVALPIMQKLGVPGVVFVPTGYVGGTNAWDAGNEPDERICDWDELLELERGGVAVESHSVSHPAFSNLTREQHEYELRASKEALEARLGRAVEFFAYPYGDTGVDAARSEEMLRRAGYQAACLYGGGTVNLAMADPFRLARLAMGPDSDLVAMLEEKT